jgi:hypothetical protein
MKSVLAMGSYLTVIYRINNRTFDLRKEEKKERRQCE